MLVLCSRNKQRSKTAETVFKNNDTLHVRSAGTASSATVKVNQSMIDWSDIVLVMEPHHRDIIDRKYDLSSTVVEILYIPDVYEYMDEELVSEFTDTIPYLASNL